MSEDDIQPPDDDAELQRILAELTTLQLVRVFIDRLAEDLPTPATGMDNAAVAMSLLGQRAKSLYANFHYSLGSPTEFAPVFAIRPLIELVILTKWITLDLELHPFLYLADSDASELAHMADVTKHAKVRGQSVPEAVSDATPIKEATRDAAVAKLRELGKNYGKDIMPNVRRMAGEVSSKIPGHKTVMDDAYIYGYKTFSPWEHTEASSFKATARETVPASGSGSATRAHGTERTWRPSRPRCSPTSWRPSSPPSMTQRRRSWRGSSATTSSRTTSAQTPCCLPVISLTQARTSSSRPAHSSASRVTGGSDRLSHV
jgi:hypothetical protein